MKRLLTLLAIAICSALAAHAQVFLIDAVKPTESTRYHREDGSWRSLPSVGGYDYKKWFYIEGPGSGLIGGEPGVAVFRLGGKYSKVSFVLGAAFANPAGNKGTVIATVTGDGKRLLDQPIHDYDAPRFFTLDVTGVDELKFMAIRGSEKAGFGYVQLWPAGKTPVEPKMAPQKLPAGKIQLVKQLEPYYQRYNGFSKLITARNTMEGDRHELIKKISINRKDYNYGIQFSVKEGFSDEEVWSYFWLNKRYDKVSFIVGPRDNQSTNATAWLTVKADKKTVYEGIVRQNGLAEQVVVDVAGAEQLSFNVQRRSSDLMGGMTFGLVEMYAYPRDYADIPQSGTVNANKGTISALPDVCPLMSNIRPYSVRGMSQADNTLFYGESRYYTFSMGGEHYYEGLLLTTGNTLLADRIDSYAEFDLAGEYDWISFDVGCLTKRHAMDDDQLRIYADEQLVFDRLIRCTWPNQHFEIPVYKCRKLRFEKPGNGKKNQTIIGVADIILYRGRPVANNIFEHEKPDCPYEADLIDLCEKPYFHFNGRFSGSITGWSMDQCFHDGSTIRESFHMKDGTEINKGFMLEANVPLGLEDLTPMDALFMFMTGVGANLSQSDAAAYTGTTGGASGAMPMGAISLLMTDPSKRQAAACAFNPYGEYQSCTFTVANMREYYDELAGMTGGQSAPLVKLNVFADQRLVGEFWLGNKMKPRTFTVPIFGCKQLMFWLEPNDVRSGQYVFYDLKVSKAPCNEPIPDSYTSAAERMAAAKKPTQSTMPERSTNTQSGRSTNAQSGRSTNAQEEHKKQEEKAERREATGNVLKTIFGVK